MHIANRTLILKAYFLLLQLSRKVCNKNVAKFAMNVAIFATKLTKIYQKIQKILAIFVIILANIATFTK